MARGPVTPTEQGEEPTSAEVVTIFEILQIATLCLDDNFAHSWHFHNQLHEVVTWNAFQLTGVPS